MSYEDPENTDSEAARASYVQQVAEGSLPEYHLDSELGALALEIIEENLEAVAEYSAHKGEVACGEEVTPLDEIRGEELKARAFEAAMRYAILKGIHNLTEKNLVEAELIETGSEGEALETAVTTSCADMLDSMSNGLFPIPEDKRDDAQNLVFRIGHLTMAEGSLHFGSII